MDSPSRSHRLGKSRRTFWPGVVKAEKTVFQVSKNQEQYINLLRIPFFCTNNWGWLNERNEDLEDCLCGLTAPGQKGPVCIATLV